ncbi:MAG: hypothetical protein AAGL68_00050 [Pseudomonadota bacterium]
MHAADKADPTNEADKPRGAYDSIVLVRPSGSRVTFEGVLLADAHNRTEHLAIWHELKLYQKSDGAFVVSICMHNKSDDIEDAMHIFNAQTIEMVMEIVERFGAGITLEGILRDTEQEDADEEEPDVLYSAMVDHQLKQIKRHFAALAGDFLFAINCFKVPAQSEPAETVAEAEAEDEAEVEPAQAAE